VAYTRAGCNFGAVSTANLELENVSSDINKVYGPNSPEAAEANSNFNMAVADFEGISIHCAAGNAVCSTANGGEPDLLPDEPGGYIGYNGLFGHKFVAPVISPGGPLQDLDGNLITDSNTPVNVGFPGFGSISAAQSLAYVAAMQEHGIPVTTSPTYTTTRLPRISLAMSMAPQSAQRIPNRVTVLGIRDSGPATPAMRRNSPLTMKRLASSLRGWQRTESTHPIRYS